MFSISTEGLPRLRTYAQALDRYENTKPIRGREKDIRPLGKRSKHHMRIEKHDDKLKAVLFGTPVLTYNTDDIVTINMGGWGTTSTHKFIDAVLGVNCGSLRGKSVLYAENGMFLIKDGMRVKWERGDNGTSRLNVLDYYPSVIHKVKRGVLAEKRKTIKEFWEYTSNLALITPRADVPVDDDGTRMREKQMKSTTFCERLIGEVLALGPEPDYEKMLLLWKKVAFASCPCDTHFDREEGRWKAVTAFVNQRSMLSFINDALKWHYRDEVFEEIVLPRGEVKTDINRKYFY